MGPLDLAIAEEQDVTLSFSLKYKTEQDHILIEKLEMFMSTNFALCLSLAK